MDDQSGLDQSNFDDGEMYRVLNATILSVAIAIHAEVARRWGELHIQQQQNAYRHRPGVPTTLDNLGSGTFEVARMLHHDEQYCFSTTRLHQDVLRELIAALSRSYGLEDSRLSVAEKVIIFLDYCGHKKSYRELRRVYQHSFKTFTRVIKAVSLALVYMFKDQTKDLPNLAVPDQIDGIYGHFKGALGALDGAHIPVRTTKIDPAPWRNRKGFYSQNVLYACDFDAMIVFAQPGYEGSAHDGTVLRKATDNGFKVPGSHYYLADGGYSEKDRRLLVPYREVADAAKRPATKEELFNLRHARLRNVVERVIGIMKKRWRILRDGPEQGFTMHQQSMFVYALAAVHNFCLQHGQTLEQDEDMLQGEDGGEDGGGDGDGDGNGGGGVMPEDAGMVRFRDCLAKNMWEEFINE